MAILGFEIEEIVRLLALMEASGLDEMVWEENGRYLRVRGPRFEKTARPAEASRPEPARNPAPHLKRLPPGKPADKSGGRKQSLGEDEIALLSPMVGVFYHTEKPGAPPLIAIGQQIAMGQTIGIIEAMKIFSEVPAEHAGVVIAIPAPDGQLVQAGAPLVVLRKLETAESA